MIAGSAQGAIGLFLLTCGFLAVPYAPSLLLVLIIAGFCSVVQIIVFPPSFGLLAESVRPEKLSRVLGMNGASLVFSGVIAAWLGA